MTSVTDATISETSGIPAGRDFGTLKMIGSIIAAIAVWAWPGLPFDPLQQRTLAIFVLAAMLWILEPVAVHATAMLIIGLLLVMVSDQSPWATADSPPYAEVLAALSSPVIVLFLGGFALAIAAARTGVDRLLAQRLLKPFAHDSNAMLWGVVLVTALFSMFLSNTATTILMLSMFGTLTRGGRLPAAVVIATAVSANLGGIATPIGTPPNAIALQYLSDLDARVSFAQWMLLCGPVVAILLALTVRVLRHWYPLPEMMFDLESIETPHIDRDALIVLVTLAVTALAWLTGDLHGINAYVVAVIPIVVFTLTGLLGRDELRRIDWDVIWLVAGGIALGRATETTGLAAAVVHLVVPEGMSVYWLAPVLMLVAWAFANFMSNTATANLLMPLAAVVGGGTPWVLVIVAIGCSLGMMFPISTPPNALAYSSGSIAARDLLRVGAVVGVVGIVVVWVWALPVAALLLRHG